MAVFTDLSPELVVIISEYIFPNDFDSLRLVSKEVKCKVDVRLEKHRQLQQRYRCCSTHGVWSSAQDGPGSLNGLLKDVIITPLHARYIQELSIYRWYRTWKTNVFITDREPTPPVPDRRRDTQQLLEEVRAIAASERLLYPPKNELHKWAVDVRRGDQTPIIGMLITLLPCLSTLYLTDIDHWADWLNDTILSITRSPAPAMLQRLTTVAVSFHDHRAAYSLITALAMLPSLRTLHAEGLGVGDEYNNRQAAKLMPMRSRISELSLRNLDSQVLLIHDLLECCQELRYFAYVTTPSVLHSLNNPNHHQMLTKYDTRSAHRSPPSYAGSLERLLLREITVDNNDYIGLFRCFPSVKDIDIELKIIHDSSELRLQGTYTAYMTSMLPISVEKVVLRYTKNQYVGAIAAVIDELCFDNGKNKKERRPHLKHVHFQARESSFPPEREAQIIPEEYRGNHFPVGVEYPCPWFNGSQRCQEIGVTMTYDGGLPIVNNRVSRSRKNKVS